MSEDDPAKERWSPGEEPILKSHLLFKFSEMYSSVTNFPVPAPQPPKGKQGFFLIGN